MTSPTEDHYEFDLVVHRLVRLRHHQGPSSVDDAVKEAARLDWRFLRELRLRGTTRGLGLHWVWWATECCPGLFEAHRLGGSGTAVGTGHG